MRSFPECPDDADFKLFMSAERSAVTQIEVLWMTYCGTAAVVWQGMHLGSGFGEFQYQYCPSTL